MLIEDKIAKLEAWVGQLTADNEALRRENERLSEEKDALAFGARHGQSLSEDAIHAIRELLNEAGVPLAAFIDDHVGNAIVQRNQERARADALAQEVERLRGAWRALDSAISSSIKENDQPHRVFRDGKLVMEGEAAEIYHAHLMLLRRMARAALGDRP